MGSNNSAMNTDNDNPNMPHGSREVAWGTGTGSFVSNDPSMSESIADLRATTAALSGGMLPGLPVRKMLRAREMGRHQRFTQSAKAYLINRLLPDRREVVESVDTKTFCCLHLPNNRLVTASQDERLRFYERKGNRYIPIGNFSVPDVGWSILDIALSSAGNHLSYVTWSDNVYHCPIDKLVPTEALRWATTYGAPQPPPRSNRFAYFSLRYSLDDHHLIAGGSDGNVYIFSNLEPTFQMFRAHEDDVNAIYCSQNNPYLFCSGGDDGLCKVWDLRVLGGEVGIPVGIFAGHRDGITYIDGHGDDRYILTNSKDQTIKIWDLRRYSSKDAEKVTLSAVRRQKWDYRYQHIPAVFRSVGPLEGDGSVMTLRGHSVQHTLIRAKFSPERTGRRYIYTGSTEGNVIVYDILTGEIAHRLGRHRSVVRDCTWHPDDSEIISVSWDGVTARWYHYDSGIEDVPSAVSESYMQSDNDDSDDNEEGRNLQWARIARLRNRILQTSVHAAFGNRGRVVP